MRAGDGTEYVLVEVADVVALIDAASGKPINEPLVHGILERFRVNLGGAGSWRSASPAR